MGVRKGQRYRHYKGNIYEIMYIAKDSSNLDDIVVYKGLYYHKEYGFGQVWTRTLKEFTSIVELDGGITVPRFALQDSYSSEDFLDKN